MVLIVLACLFVALVTLWKWRYNRGFRDGFVSGRHAELRHLKKKIEERRKNVN